MDSKFKIALFLLIYLLGIADVNAQAPNMINYQAVARNTSTGVELSNQPIFVVVKILENESNGTIVYQENHSDVVTNAFGLFSLAIGGGEVVSGDFANINWQNGMYWLQIDIDAGAGMETMGAMQFVSVPYALHAETVTNADDADADPQNELVSGFTFNPVDNNLSLIQPGSTLTQNLSSLVNDADSDPSNELVYDFQFDPETNILSLDQANGSMSQNLSSLVNDADSDPENELVSDFVFNTTTNMLSLTQAGGTISQDLTPLLNDADSDPTNEAITSFSLVGTNLIVHEEQNWTVNLSQLVDDADADPENELITDMELINDTILEINEGGETHQLNLASLKEDNDWKISEDGTIVSNIGEKVGIGTTDPESTLDVNGSVGYRVKILTNLLGSISYTISDLDHIVVCKVSPPNSAVITINLPSAATCEGREIIIRKTGAGPIFPDVNINFGSDLLDYNIDDIQLTDNHETVILISLGADGWTRILKN